MRHTGAAVLVFAVLPAGGAWPDATPTRWTPPELASDQYESSPTFSPDGREIVFMRSDTRFDNYRLLSSRCEGGRWTPPRPPLVRGTARRSSRPTRSSTPDGGRLYFVSSRHAYASGRGHDDLDILSVDRLPNGAVGRARGACRSP